MHPEIDDPLMIAGQAFSSRLMVGTGKYRDFTVMREALEASEAQIVTVAIRRVELGAPGHDGLLEQLDLDRFQLLPNTAGCRTAAEAVRVAKLARLLTGVSWLKLEVIPDARYLLPDGAETLRAAEALIGEGFTVLPYIQADPVLARQLETLGCATVMPLASPIGSGRGLQTTAQIRIMLEHARVPVVVDAGLGVPSEAGACLEMGAGAVLVNTAIAEARDPVLMARAFRAGVQAGREAYLAGRMPVREEASPSTSPLGVVRLPDPEVPL
ncbi:thiazole synthase [Deinococcus peraridilitoris]|uniref:Thiazole synthase n=1 Tax=Deinococcus peraridilitoris (strain DSM 19664 / LMG 22246 / CIP 109416 / KR-200) TaxID=937777 RepID=K9ZX86_DEIPD|nr:thiazole synthase [Deinococcus peraridilitoris]AFZ65809.1 putative enzyme of thiazole biosynthesis [Deinococcus peraridilitoris DSM 19664]